MPYVVYITVCYLYFRLDSFPPNFKDFSQKWYNVNMTQHSRILLSDTTPIRLTPPGLHTGIDLTIQNPNANGFIYLGGPDVNISNYGYRIYPNNAFSVELAGHDSLYAISDIDELPLVMLKFGLESGF